MVRDGIVHATTRVSTCCLFVAIAAAALPSEFAQAGTTAEPLGVWQAIDEQFVQIVTAVPTIVVLGGEGFVAVSAG
jgi:hypothetical protein